MSASKHKSNAEQWQKLSPDEFRKLQEYASYSTKRVADILNEFKDNGKLAEYRTIDEESIVEQFISVECFKKFIPLYLEVQAEDIDTLCTHLFLSFIKRPSQPPTSPIEHFHVQDAAKRVSKVAAVAVAPFIDTNSSPTDDNCPDSSAPETSRSAVQSARLGIEEKFHNLKDRFTKTIIFGSHPHLHTIDRQEGTTSASPIVTSGSAHNVGQQSLIPKTGGGHTGWRKRGSPNHSMNSRNSSKRSDHSCHVISPTTVLSSNTDDCSWQVKTGDSATPLSTVPTNTSSFSFGQFDINNVEVQLKEIVCYLSLLEGGTPEDKLEFVFRLYDADGNGILDSQEMESIISQMMSVAEYLNWDTIELRPILQDMMHEIDYDDDGEVTLEEWRKGGLTTIPLLVLLGFDTEVQEDGTHVWSLKHFSRTTYCNLCLKILVGFGKQGLCCNLCKYTVHERCVGEAPNNCISTYVKSRKNDQQMKHYWLDGNCVGRCVKCKKKIHQGLCGKHCRWCQIMLHNECVSNWSDVCTLGQLRYHILPPTAIFPMVLERQKSNIGQKISCNAAELQDSESTASNTSDRHQSASASPSSNPSQSFQITPSVNTRPLVVFINPKSGGKQGDRLYKKFQYLLNPRQVFNLAKTGPIEGLRMFKDVPNVNILCAGGDGTVGWILDVMDKLNITQSPNVPPVAILPLGTGNDLARCLRWGGGYENEDLVKILQKVEKAEQVKLDRWKINITNVNEEEQGDPVPYGIINNYFSIGVDASIAHRFHQMREKHPEKFNSRFKNKLFYFEFGTEETMQSSCKSLQDHFDIVCDSVKLDLSNKDLEGIALLNIPSIYGGSNLWGEKASGSKLRNKRPSALPLVLPSLHSNAETAKSSDLSMNTQDMGDKLIEVVGMSSAMHAGLVKVGIKSSGNRLQQCKQVTIKTKKCLPMQIDGEPWMQPPCTIDIEFYNQVSMLMAKPHQKRSIWNLWKRTPRSKSLEHQSVAD